MGSCRKRKMEDIDRIVVDDAVGVVGVGVAVVRDVNVLVASAGWRCE